MTPNYRARQDALLAAAASAGVDAVALVPGSNMVYFTGLRFHLSERPIIVLFTSNGLSIIIPQLETPKLDERPDLKAKPFSWSDTEGYPGAFFAAVNELGLRGKLLGVDGLTMRVSEWLAFQAADSTLRVKAMEQAIFRIRAIKTPDEVEAMRRAIQISEQGLAKLLPQVKPGMSEEAIASILSQEMAALGAQGNAFEPLVQTGPNSALPHGFLTDRKLQKDEFLLIDYGARFDSYPADITRTFCLGTPSAEMQKIYDTVLRANEAARAVAKPGVTCGAVDKAARDVIDAAGYGQYFIHRTGHGLGLDGHELPQIASGVSDTLEVGMVFTVEPGIYIPGMGGVRIEDNVVVTASGVETLTSYPRRLTL